MCSIYVNYTESTIDEALKVRAYLREAGHIVWLVDIEAQSQWGPHDFRSLAIQESKIFVFLIDASSLQSPLILQHLSSAKKQNKTVLPLLVGNLPPTITLPPQKYIDATQDFTGAMALLSATLHAQITSQQSLLSQNQKFYLGVVLIGAVGLLAIIFALLILFAQQSSPIIGMPTRVQVSQVMPVEQVFDDIPTAMVAQQPTKEATATEPAPDDPTSTEAAPTGELSPTPTSSTPTSTSDTSEETNLPSNDDETETTEATEENDSGPSSEVVATFEMDTTEEPDDGEEEEFFVDYSSYDPSRYESNSVESVPEVPSAEGRAFAAFSAEPESGIAPLTVTFTNRSTGEIKDYFWDFDGDGSVDSTDANPQPYTYERPGSYSVRLAVMAADNLTYAAKARIRVTSASEVSLAGRAFPEFIMEPSRGFAPLEVSFTDMSTGDVIGYQWDFNGDNTIDSTDANPDTFVYEEPGVYFPSLIVEGSAGHSPPFVEVVRVRESLAGSGQQLPTYTPTFTRTPTPTQWPIYPTRTPPSATDTPTATLTVTPTETFTSKSSPTVTLTLTPILTPTSTATPTATRTFTPMPTFTPTHTPTQTPIATLTETPTETFTPSFTPSPTHTYTPTATASETAAPTYTPTETFTPSPTHTYTHTPTHTHTATNTPTHTHTYTPTFTPTHTPTFTPTHTHTPSPTVE